jgi:hypothetical protein
LRWTLCALLSNFNLKKDQLMTNKHEHPDVVVFPGRMPPHEIAFVNALIDDNDGMAVVRTENPTEGRMEFWVSPDLTDTFVALFEAIKAQTGIDMSLGEPVEKSSEMINYLQRMEGN